MVGHTGVEAAAVKAVETVDECVGRAVEAVKEVNGQMFICADHGNAEQLVDYETGEPFTAHTTNPVPFILVNADPQIYSERGRLLAEYYSNPDRTDGNGKTGRDDRRISSYRKIKIIYRSKIPDKSSGSAFSYRRNESAGL